MPTPRYLVAAAVVALLAGPAAAEVTEQNFRGGRTSDLAALCSAGPNDRMHTAALNWCHGFMVGAGQYHHSVSAPGGTSRRLFCMPNPEPTLDQARQAF